MKGAGAVAAELERKLGYAFKNPELLTQALTHRSYTNERGVGGDNQRLEFLGDAILEQEVSLRLYQRFPEAAEGQLSRDRARLVNARALARFAAEELELGRFLRLGQGEERQQGRRRPGMLADALEALIAALYLDGGPAPVARLAEALVAAGIAYEARDFKTRLQEEMQQSGGRPPRYELLERRGEDHEPVFLVAVCDENGREMARGEGPSLKNAEQRAAEQACSWLAKNGKKY